MPNQPFEIVSFINVSTNRTQGHWGDRVSRAALNAGTVGVADDCGVSDSQCLHGAERFFATVDNAGACADLQANDELDVYDWTCIDISKGRVRFASEGLKSGLGIGDLLDLANGAWKANRLIITSARTLTQLGSTASGIWYSNRIEKITSSNSGAVVLTTADTVTVFSAHLAIDLSNGIAVRASHQTLFFENGALDSLTVSPTANNCDPTETGTPTIRCLIAIGSGVTSVGVEGDLTRPSLTGVLDVLLSVGNATQVLINRAKFDAARSHDTIRAEGLAEQLTITNSTFLNSETAVRLSNNKARISDSQFVLGQFAVASLSASAVELSRVSIMGFMEGLNLQNVAGLTLTDLIVQFNLTGLHFGGNTLLRWLGNTHIAGNSLLACRIDSTSQDVTDGDCFIGANTTIDSAVLDTTVQVLNPSNTRLARALVTTYANLRAPNWQVTVDPAVGYWLGDNLSFTEGSATVAITKTAGVYSAVITVDGESRTIKISENSVGLPTSYGLSLSAALSIPSNLTVANGVYSSSSLSGTTGNATGTSLLDTGITRLPVPTKLRSFRTYLYNGVLQTAEILGATLSGTTNPSATNLAGIFVAPGPITLNNCTINGLLITENMATLKITGNNLINAPKGFPGLIASGILNMQQTATASRLTVNGYAYLGDLITNAGYSVSSGWLRIFGRAGWGATAPSVTALMTSPITIDASYSDLSAAAYKLISADDAKDPLLRIVLD